MLILVKSLSNAWKPILAVSALSFFIISPLRAHASLCDSDSSTTCWDKDPGITLSSEVIVYEDDLLLEAGVWGDTLHGAAAGAGAGAAMGAGVGTLFGGIGAAPGAALGGAAGAVVGGIIVAGGIIGGF